jgi:hypothetical protein
MHELGPPKWVSEAKNRKSIPRINGRRPMSVMCLKSRDAALRPGPEMPVRARQSEAENAVG